MLRNFAFTFRFSFHLYWIGWLQLPVMVKVIALAPDHAVVELNDPAVRRVDSTGIPRHDPKPVRGEPVGAGAERFAEPIDVQPKAPIHLDVKCA